MDRVTKTELQALAKKYESPDFINGDPSQFMHRFTDVKEQEIVAFIAANLSFGNRKQIVDHVQRILDAIQSSKCSPSQWILAGKYTSFFDRGGEFFYQPFYIFQIKNDI